MPFIFGSKVREFIRNNVEKLVPLIDETGHAVLSYEQMVELYPDNWSNDCPKYSTTVLPLHLGDDEFALGVWVNERNLNIFINRNKETNESQEVWTDRKRRSLINWFIPLMDIYDW